MLNLNQDYNRYQLESSNTTKEVVELFCFLVELPLTDKYRTKLEELILAAELSIEEHAYSSGLLTGYCAVL